MKKNYVIRTVLIIVATVLNGSLFAQPGTGDLFEGMTRKISYNQMIPPYGIEVSFHKTVHIIFPAPIVYVDLGTHNIIAGKADGAENVLRVKSAVDGFDAETNFSVITDEGSFYSFNAKFVHEPEMLNIEMKDFLSGSDTVTPMRMNVFLNELDNENPVLVKLIMTAIYEDNSRHIKHIGSKYFGIQFMLKGIFIHNDLFYLHTQIDNSTNVGYEIDCVRFRIVDKKVPKRTAIQETIVYPIRTYNETTVVKGTKVRTVFAIPKFSIPNDKMLLIELVEKGGARHQVLYVESSDLNNAKIIKNLKV